MPENKNMKIQWMKIDGRNVPFVLPQVWNPDINDWEVTGSDKPLPTQDNLLLNKLNELDQKIDGIIDGTTPVPTQLTGSIVVHQVASDVSISRLEAYRTDRIRTKTNTVIVTIRDSDGSGRLIANIGARVGYFNVPGDRLFVYSVADYDQDRGDGSRYLMLAIPVLSQELVIDITNNNEDFDGTIDRMSIIGVNR